MRTVNKNNPKNIKCEHCMFFERAASGDWREQDWCCLHQVNKHYWNRCKDFNWINEHGNMNIKY